MKTTHTKTLKLASIAVLCAGNLIAATTCNITPAHANCTHTKPNPSTGYCPTAPSGLAVCLNTPQGQCPGKAGNYIYGGFPIGADVANATSTPDSAGNNHYTEHSNVGTDPAYCTQALTCTWYVQNGNVPAYCGTLAGSEQTPTVSSMKVPQTCTN